MNRRGALVSLALGSAVCSCSLLFSLDALDPTGTASRDAGPQMSTSDAADAGLLGDSSDGGPSASAGDAEDEGDATSVSDVIDDVAPEADAPVHVDASVTDAEAADTSAPEAAPPLPSFVPASYTGTPFKTLTIPGTIYIADYDKGGAGVAYCINGTVTGAACANGITLTDWCCGKMSGCDERAQPSLCPVYRADDDNAGLSHMNTGSPDDYAASGPSWAASPNGPVLNGPMVKVGTAVPQDIDTTTEEDVYLSHTNAGEWVKYTIQVLEAGKYSIGGFMAVPPTTTLSIEFGNQITTGTFAVPVSPCTAPCTSTFHAWGLPSNLASVTFPAAGIYLMTFTIVNNALNPNYLTFTKM